MFIMSVTVLAIFIAFVIYVLYISVVPYTLRRKLYACGAFESESCKFQHGLDVEQEIIKIMAMEIEKIH